jgi:hypothetical protein
MLTSTDHMLGCVYVGQYQAVGIATAQFLLSAAFRLVVGPTEPLIAVSHGPFFLGAKQPALEADYLPPSSAMLMPGILPELLSYVFTARCLIT